MSVSAAVAQSRPVGALELLKTNDRFRRLWTAQLISAGGDWFNNVALLGLVLHLTNSGFGASLVIISSTTPQFFATPIAGPIVDRFDRRTIMIVTNLVSTVLALLFLLVHSADNVWLIYAGSALLIISASFFGPAASASIPNVVSKDQLFAANTLSGATWGIMAMVGSALGGLVAALFGRDAAFIINSISFLVAGAIIATIAIPSPKVERAITPWRDFVDGLRYLRGYLPAVVMVAVKTGWGLAGGVIVLLSIFGTTVFRAGDAGIGLLYAARGMGALVGPLIVQRVVGHHQTRLRQAVWIAFVCSGVGYLLFATAG
ncbi:MAG TPA: MFS transporter, partial [Aggregatilineales bacterium]|nr:MFS transporter [Aggregatilineales bacterium]